MSDIVKMADKKKEFIMLEDGFWYYWPSCDGGAISAEQLREIAAALDHRNKDWREKMEAFFNKENGK